MALRSSGVPVTSAPISTTVLNTYRPLLLAKAHSLSHMACIAAEPDPADPGRDQERRRAAEYRCNRS